MKKFQNNRNSNLPDEEIIRKQLQSVDWSFSDAVTSYLTHGVHPYPAKFIPQIAYNLIKILSLPGETVLDPFCGSGTTALESKLHNRNSINIDLNPLAKIIGIVKTAKLNSQVHGQFEILKQDLRSIDSTSLDYDSNIQAEKEKLAVPSIPNIEKWFHSNSIKELSTIFNSTSKIKDNNAKNIALLAFSKTILRASNQASETQYSAKIKKIEKGYVLRMFLNNLGYTLSKVKEQETKISSCKTQFLIADLRKPIVGNSSDHLIKPNSVDLVVTSPPYPNATDYHLYHRFRLFWLGFDPREMGKNEIGSHLRHQKEKTGFQNYLTEMKDSLENIFLALKPGRFAAIVVGDAIFNGQTFHTSKELSKVAETIGLEKFLEIERPVHNTKRSFVTPARRAKLENILILRKPSVEVKEVTLNEPNYKLWKYEKLLQTEEIKKLTNTRNLKKGNNLIKTTINLSNLSKLDDLTFIKSYSYGNTFNKTRQAIFEKSSLNDNSKRKGSNYFTHGLHPYKGKFYPQLAKSLFNIFGLKKGETVLDPFCGSGTVPLESFLNGYRAYGCDFNPLAVQISRSKVEILRKDPVKLYDAVEMVTQSLKKLPKQIPGLSFYSEENRAEILTWFPEPVSDKISYLIETINQIEDSMIREFFLVILSSIIRQISQQEPRDLRIRKRKNPITNAPVFKLFLKNLSEQTNKISKFFEIKETLPYHMYDPNIWLGDSRNITELQEHIKSKIDLIVTSPPYATALPYIDTDRLSLLTIMGMNSKSRRIIEEELIGSRETNNKTKLDLESRIIKNDFGEITSEKAIQTIKQIHKLNENANVGFRRKNMSSLLYKYFNDITMAFTNLDNVLKRNGGIFIIIGDNFTTTENLLVPIRTTEILKETCKKIGWKLENEFAINVTTEDYIHAKNAIKENSILQFSKTV